jgi:TolB-like protein/Flp pilus assembly protein TadD
LDITPVGVVGNGLRLDVDKVGCDVAEFEAAIESGNPKRAVELYRGPFLDGLFVKEALEFEEWVRAERERFGRMYAGALEALVEGAGAQDGQRQVVRWLQKLTAHDPYNGAVTARLMKALAAAGQTAEALREADAHAGRMREEFDTDSHPAVVEQIVRLREGPVIEVPPLAPTERSIAVLPFENRSSEPETEYFSDGVMDDVLTALSKIRDLRVISRTSVMQYKGTRKNVRQIAEELGVGNILEGSVRREGDRVRITAQLIDARTDEHLWAERYDRKLSSIFEIQDDVAERIATSLKATLSDEEGERIVAGRTGDLEAYDLYLKGREYLFSFTLDMREHIRDCGSSIALFKEALALDPEYALAHAGLGMAYSYLKLHSGASVLDSALVEANEAITLDPNLAEGYAARGRVNQARGRFEEAIEDARRAIELDPNNAEATRVLAGSMELMGRLDETLMWAKRAVSLEPTVGLHYAWVSRTHFFLGDFDEAEQWARKVSQIEPDSGLPHVGLAFISLSRGEVERATAETRTARSIDPNNRWVLFTGIMVELHRGNYEAAKRYVEKASEEVAPEYTLPHYLGYIHWKTGNRDKAKEILRQAKEYALKTIEGGKGYYRQLCLAQIHAIQGEPDEALRWLREAIDNGWRGYHIQMINPLWENLHEDPRYISLMQEMKADLDRMRARVERSTADTVHAGSVMTTSR